MSGYRRGGGAGQGSRRVPGAGLEMMVGRKEETGLGSQTECPPTFSHFGTRSTPHAQAHTTTPGFRLVLRSHTHHGFGCVRACGPDDDAISQFEISARTGTPTPEGENHDLSHEPPVTPGPPTWHLDAHGAVCGHSVRPGLSAELKIPPFSSPRPHSPSVDTVAPAPSRGPALRPKRPRVALDNGRSRALVCCTTTPFQRPPGPHISRLLTYTHSIARGRGRAPSRFPPSVWPGVTGGRGTVLRAASRKYPRHWLA
jgi:hypothetical protein